MYLKELVRSRASNPPSCFIKHIPRLLTRQSKVPKVRIAWYPVFITTENSNLGYSAEYIFTKLSTIANSTNIVIEVLYIGVFIGYISYLVY
jgi:hypothetical protein